jgi:hypothetical protein
MPWVCLLHFQLAASDLQTSAMLNAVCTAAFNDAQGRFVTDWPVSHTLTNVTAVDIGINTPATGINTGGSFTGTHTGAQDSAACILVNMHTGTRYRGGHGRIYWPGASTFFQADARTWTSTEVANWQTTFQLIVADCNSAFLAHGATAVVQVIPRYNYTVVDDTLHKKYVRQRDSWKQNDAVFNIQVNPLIKSQRRRLG